MFGQECPECKSYFRANRVGCRLCPYCGYEAPEGSLQFLTTNQRAFITMFCNRFLTAFEASATEVIDLDELIKTLPENRPGWVYSEARQQHRFICTQCDTEVDILGDYALCPTCAEPNWRQVIERMLDDIEAALGRSETTLTDKDERGAEWGRQLVACVAALDALGRMLVRELERLPAVPRRKADVSRLSLQSIRTAAERLAQWYGFEIFKGLAEADQVFIDRMFNRRHLVDHNASRVDQEYLDRTGDTTVKLNQRIRVSSSEVKRVARLTRIIAGNVVADFTSML
jgi:hypothetical protein